MTPEDYVGFEVAKLLKEREFKEWCFKCYGVAVLHNGVAISFDEECELKDEGRENEIEYLEGGVLYDCGCNNSDKDAKVWAAPTLWDTMKWLRKKYKLNIIISVDDLDWFYSIIDYTHKGDVKLLKDLAGFNSYESACESAIEYCLTNLI